MRRTGIAVITITALAVGAGTGYAQQQAGNARKAPSQTHDQGVDDDKAPPGQASKGPGDRIVEQVPITVLSTGTAIAELDESFDEAIVVKVNPDGTRTYSETKGIKAAEDLVHASPAPQVPAPALEEK